MNALNLIKSKIIEMRGKKVMLDFDLADVYQTTTKMVNQAYRRNLERFPEDFAFQLIVDKQLVKNGNFCGLKLRPQTLVSTGICPLLILNTEHFRSPIF